MGANPQIYRLAYEEAIRALARQEDMSIVILQSTRSKGTPTMKFSWDDWEPRSGSAAA